MSRNSTKSFKGELDRMFGDDFTGLKQPTRSISDEEERYDDTEDRYLAYRKVVKDMGDDRAVSVSVPEEPEMDTVEEQECPESIEEQLRNEDIRSAYEEEISDN